MIAGVPANLKKILWSKVSSIMTSYLFSEERLRNFGHLLGSYIEADCIANKSYFEFTMSISYLLLHILVC